MTHTPYEYRALRFAQKVLCPLFEDCYTLDDFILAIRDYNNRHSVKLVYHFGVSRIAIVRADYVVKFNFTPDEEWNDGTGLCRAGDNETEYEMYQKAVRDGFAHLLAKTTPFIYHGRRFAIMPRIDHVGDGSRLWWDTVTEEEYDWLEDNVYDLHDNNVGYKNGKVVVIDYAFTAPL